MTKRNQSSERRVPSRGLWAWTLPALSLTPLWLMSACVDSGVIGDDCPAGAECPEPSAGTGNSAGRGSSTAGSSSTAGTGASSGGAGATGGSGSAGTGGAPPGAGSGGSGNGDVVCGGLLPASCAKSQFCLYTIDAQCGAADQTGICTPIPDACDANYSPVCGCDGKTYGNDCEAATHGVSVAKRGECATGGTKCGGRGGVECASGQYCKFEPADQCGRADANGTCTPIPKDTGCLANYDPVCGCDGKTYGNACEATRVGVSVDHVGACATGPTCGGLIGATCDAGYFCKYPLAMACGNADGTGNCSPIPQACDLVLDEVCGCDGKTYGNECAANSAGYSISSKGACK